MRLVTRPDFDGIVCGSLITAMEEISAYLFVEPKWIQDGQVEIRKGDIITNLPYHPECTLWFDHHITNQAPGFDSPMVPGKGCYRLAPSAARVVFEYYTSEYWSEHPGSRTQMHPKAPEGLKVLTSDRLRVLLEATDKIDAGLLTPQEVLHPEGYVLISMTLNGKNAENEAYWLKLIHLLRDATLDEVLNDEEVQRHCQQILDMQDEIRQVLQERAALEGNVIVVDLRGTKDVTEGNRFLLYTLFSAGNISLKITDDTQRPDTASISVGYNIFNPTSKVNVGALMQRYGGGGHRVVGSCRVPSAEAERAAREILRAIKEVDR